MTKKELKNAIGRLEKLAWAHNAVMKGRMNSDELCEFIETEVLDQSHNTNIERK
jgi:hypothetical protein